MSNNNTFDNNMMSSSTSSGSKNVCVITNGDSLLGYCLAYRFLEGMKKKEDPNIEGHKMRILCRDKQGVGLDRLEKMGAEVYQINYKEEDKLCHALKDVDSIMFIPENSQHRLKEAENLLKAAKHQDVEHVAMASWVGVDRIHKAEQDNDQDILNSSEYRNMMEYCQIEKHLKEHFSGNKHCIVRHQLYSQLFYYMAPQIEGENCVALPVKKDAKWGTVNLNDVVDAIFCLANKSREGRRREPNAAKKNCYEFTCPRTMTSEEMAREIGEGLGRQDMKFKEIDMTEFRKHLEQMRKDKRFQERPHSDNKFGEGRDGWWSFPLGKFLNEHCIEVTMEILCLACKGHQDKSSNDLKEILDRNPQTLKEYFRTNRDQFKHLK